VRVVRGHHYGEADERRLRQEIRARLGQTAFEIEYPAEVERSATGKLRLVINRIPAGRLGPEGDAARLALEQ